MGVVYWRWNFGSTDKLVRWVEELLYDAWEESPLQRFGNPTLISKARQSPQEEIRWLVALNSITHTPTVFFFYLNMEMHSCYYWCISLDVSGI